MKSIHTAPNNLKNTIDMKRIIKDVSNLPDKILNLILKKYPDGFEESDIITFKNAQGETIEAIEVRTKKTIYLVKVGRRLEEYIDTHQYIDELVDSELNNLQNIDEDIEYED